MLIHKTFLAQELAVKHEFELPNGDRQLVRGRFDSLVYDFVQQRLCVVEYKTYQAIEPAAQLAQVALYSYMLQQKLKVNINSAVYSVLPDWKGVEYPWDLLEDTLHQLIPRKLMQMRDWLSWRSPNPNPPPMTAHLELCNICPQKNKCQTYFETDAIAAPSEPQVPDLVLSDNIPPLVTSTVAESFALDYSKPIKVEPLQVESLQVKTVSVLQEAQRVKASDNVARQLVEVLQAFNVGVDYLRSARRPSFYARQAEASLGGTG